MNIFRDLVDELKEENLLEETVIDPVSDEKASPDSVSPDSAEKAAESVDGAAVSDEDASAVPPKDEDAAALAPNGDADVVVINSDSVAHEVVADSEPADPVDIDSKLAAEPEENRGFLVVPPEETDDVFASGSDSADEGPALPTTRTLEEERKFYRQRAMDEVTGLQLVEHVISGVEREQMKTVPKSFDDLAVKRALHDFLKVVDDLNSPEHAKSEFQLMQETENWASALSRRDRNISVAHLRRYCETTKPSLSSQAMISLARFYRNSPFSESVRSKFDLVFTKLFSKEVGNEKRAVVFDNEELVRHIQELYADWSSVPLYSTEDDDPNLLLAALKFQEFVNEANEAESFDELVRKDFFKRLKVFKEKNSENFFAPILIAAAIESNVAVGNRYVELIEKERLSSGDALSEKYGMAHDNAISEATSKTLELLDVLRDKKPEPVPEPVAEEPEADDKTVVEAPNEESDSDEKTLVTLGGGANKWLIIATVVVLALSGWYFMQSPSQRNKVSVANGQAKEFQLSGTPLNDHVHSARISKSTLFGITRVSWDKLSKDEREAVMKKALSLGEQNSFSKVHFLNKDGKTVAFASKSRVEVR